MLKLPVFHDLLPFYMPVSSIECDICRFLNQTHTNLQ